jgi:hypothetical protein
MKMTNSCIIAHRGLWKPPNKGNSIQEIVEAFSAGFGIEFDIRDFRGKIAVAHDPISDNPILLKELLSFLNHNFVTEPKPIVALNVKSDGLLDLFSEDENRMLSNLNHFFFDMSVPESVKYAKHNRILATRVSELEPLRDGSNLSPREINWVDGFYENWWVNLPPEKIFSEKTKICILVSPEIHGREHLQTWEWAKRNIAQGFDIRLCTDYPVEALRFLND